MLVSVVVEKGHSLLLERAENNTWALPNIEIEDNADPISAIVAKCASFHIGIEVVRQYYHSDVLEDAHICFYAELISYTNRPSEEAVQWMDSREIGRLNYTLKFKRLLNIISSEYQIVHQYEKIVDECVEKMASIFGARIEKSFNISSCNIFVQNDYGNYCPFIFKINYYIDTSQDFVNYSICWPLKRMIAFGDKSDLYFLFSAMMAITQKVFFGTNIFVEYLSLFDSYEINAGCLHFDIEKKALSKREFAHQIESCFGSYLLSLIAFDRFIGSFSLKIADSLTATQYTSFFSEKADGEAEKTSYILREEHQFYWDGNNDIIFLQLNNGTYNLKAFKGHNWKIVDGVDGKIIYQVDNDISSYNFIPTDSWDKIQLILLGQNIDKYSIVCQENFLFLLTSAGIWGISGDYRNCHVQQEIKKISEKQAYENSILHFQRRFKWRYPLNAGRFEELIADLVEKEPMVAMVRLMGKSNNSDGGRDLLIFEERLVDGVGASRKMLILGQCKAHQKTVGKSDVRDIRDMLDNYESNGFFLAVSSTISVPLIDYLCRLKQKYNVDWWTEREIFMKLRQQPQIADAYPDLLEISEDGC